MNMTILVLGVSQWEFDGKSGTSLFYTGISSNEESGKNGLFPTKKTISNTLGQSLQNVPLPALCKIDFDMVPKSNGSLDLVIHNIQHVKHLKLD